MAHSDQTNDVRTLISPAATAPVSLSAMPVVVDRQMPVANRIPSVPNGMVIVDVGGTGMVSATAVVPGVTVVELCSFTYRTAALALNAVIENSVPAEAFTTVPFAEAAELRTFGVGVVFVAVTVPDTGCVADACAAGIGSVAYAPGMTVHVCVPDVRAVQRIRKWVHAFTDASHA